MSFVKFAALFGIFALTACSSKERDRNRSRMDSFERALRVGATKDEIRHNGGEVTNCRGSELSYERCETTFWNGDDPIGLVPSEVGAPVLSQDHNRAFTLHFNGGKLERWEKSDSKTLRKYP